MKIIQHGEKFNFFKKYDELNLALYSQRGTVDRLGIQ